MKKFLILLKKEINELLTLQTLIPLIVMVVIFISIGNIIGSETKKEKLKSIKLYVIDYDKSLISKEYINFLKSNNIKIFSFKNLESLNKDQKKEIIGFLKSNNTFSHLNTPDILIKFSQEAKKNNINTVIFIPEGFGKNIINNRRATIYPLSILTSFSIVKLSSSKNLDTTIALLNTFIENYILSEIKNKIISYNNKIKFNESFFKNPLKIDYSLYVNKKIANIHPAIIGGFVISQSVIIPIVIFMIIIFSTQMVATSIAAEKENKTLETLLSMPVKRTHIVSAKMLGAGVVSMLMAIIYIIGFRYYLNGITGRGFSSEQVNALKPILDKLELSLQISDYILLCLSIFGAVLTALAIALIIGAFAEDVKQIQTLITPIIFLLMIPYILSIFLDINSLSPVIKYIIYAIPFAHPFFATTNLFFGNIKPVIYGILYQFIIFMILVIIAGRIFSSDKILTMKLKLSKLRKK